MNKKLVLFFILFLSVNLFAKECETFNYSSLISISESYQRNLLIGLSEDLVNIDFTEGKKSDLCGCSVKDQDCLYDCMISSESYREEYWGRNAELPLKDKVAFGTIEIVRWKRAQQALYGRPITAKTSTNIEFKKLLIEAIDLLPSSFSERVSSKIAGIMIMEDTGNSGQAEVVFKRGSKVEFNKNSDLHKVFILLNAKRFDDSSTSKRSNYLMGLFKDDGSNIKIIKKMMEEDKDGRVFNILNTLIHELAHADSVIGDATIPYPWLPGQDIEDPNDFPFFTIDWKVSEESGKIERRSGDVTSVRERIKSKELGLADASTLFDTLKNSEFPTFYSTSSFGEDYADSMTSYIWVNVLGFIEEFYILNGNGTSVGFYPSCWIDKTCENKKRFFAEILELNK
ncbi:MAG: hypothetical protein AB8E15_05945 [Bdellovibrionales bacterium]